RFFHCGVLQRGDGSPGGFGLGQGGVADRVRRTLDETGDGAAAGFLHDRRAPDAFRPGGVGRAPCADFTQFFPLVVHRTGAARPFATLTGLQDGEVVLELVGRAGAFFADDAGDRTTAGRVAVVGFEPFPSTDRAGEQLGQVFVGDAADDTAARRNVDR